MQDRIGPRKLEPRLAAVLAYMLGPVTGIIVLLIERRDRFVRFHALQSIVYSSAVVVLLVALVIAAPAWLVLMTAIAAWAGWAILMLRAARGEMYQLPLVGSWAQANA